MTKLEKEINRIREENKVHLAGFEKWLADNSMAK
jgi:hypothetical protein